MIPYSIFIFRRDLRLIDNRGLIFAMKNFTNIIPIFIFTPEQITNRNKFRSENAIQFMVECLLDLDHQLKNHHSKLHLFYGDNIEILEKISEKILIKHIIFNVDYTPYAIKRDHKIKNFCLKNDILCHRIEDYLLAPIGTFNKSDDSPYVVFTPFCHHVLTYKISQP